MRGGKDDLVSAESWTVRDRPDAPRARASALVFSPGDVVLERYELREVLGRGGMGIVFRAYDRVLDQEIAIKIVRAEYAGDRVWAQRLAREVRLARQINHANVCRVFDVGQADTHPFLTMELAGRGTLRQEIAAGRAAPVEQRLWDAQMIAAGLAAIHRAGIVHRDLAPQNVLRMDDGSLVLSDFGLATDRADGNSSVQGGTVAYMAPELVRGASATVASDIWSLGVVIHECMFGVRPKWAPNGREMLRPSIARPLTDVERRVLEICRACASVSPDERPRSADRVAHALMTGGRLSKRLRRLPALYAAALLAFIGFAAALARTYVRDRRGSRGDALESEVVGASGTAQDWTRKAKILASIPDKIRCMTLLPDRRTVRFVWGTPPRAEDLDTVSGERVPSPLVPAAYAEGCPDVTRDGSKIVFAGHDRDLRPAAFVSSHPDGRDAVPVVGAGEPSLFSEPAWLPDNQSFLYSLDPSHSAVFSTTTRTSVVVPADTHLTFTTGYHVVGDAIFVTTYLAGERIGFRRLHFPHLDQDLRFVVEGYRDNVGTLDGRFYYLAGMFGDRGSELFVFDSATRTLRRSGFIEDRNLQYLVGADAGLVFASTWSQPRLVVSSPSGEVRRFNLPSDVWQVDPCGEGLIGSRGLVGKTHLVRLDWSGRQVGELKVGRSPRAASCSSDGRVLYYQERIDESALVRCESSRCESIYRGWVLNFRLSPGGDRIAFLGIGDDGLTVRWVRADGQGGAHDIVKTDVPCPPGWSSENTVWVASRRGADVVWREFVADTGAPTGMTAPGSYDCRDAEQDPQFPVREPAKVEWTWRSEVRLMPADQLRSELTRSFQ